MKYNVKTQEELEDFELLKALRDAKEKEAASETISLSEVKEAYKTD